MANLAKDLDAEDLALSSGARRALEEADCAPGFIEKFQRTVKAAGLRIGIRSIKGFTAFVLLPRSASQRAELLAHIRAWVGENFAHIRPWKSLRHTLQSGAPDGGFWLDTLETLKGAEPIVLRAPDWGFKPAAEAIQRCLHMRMQCPPDVIDLILPVSHILVDLDEALAAGDVPKSKDFAEKARQRGVDPIQWQGLRVRCDVAEGRFSSAVDLAVESKFHRRPMPSLVAKDLLKAIYFRCLDKNFSTANWEEGLDALRSDEAARELLRALPETTSTSTPASRLAWAAKCIISPKSDAKTAFENFLEESPADEHPQLRELVKVASLDWVGDDLESEEGQESEVRIPQEAQDSRREDTTEGDLVQPDVVRDLGGSEAPREPVGEEIAKIAIDSWRTWADRIAEEGNLGDARDAVDEKHLVWSRALLDNPALAADTAASIELLAAAADSDAIVDIFLGVLLRDLVELRQQAPETNVSHLRCIFEALLTCLYVSGFSGNASLQWVESLLEQLFFCGSRLTAEHLGALTSIWLRYPLRKTAVSAALDVVSLLKTVDCEDDDRRDDVLAELVRPILIEASGQAASSDALEVAELCTLLKEMRGVENRVASEIKKLDNGAEENLPIDNLKGKKILFYTLNASAAKNASKWIEENVTGCKVTTSNSYAGNTQLQNQLRSQDYVVIAWRSAKHAATDFIKDRVDSSKILYADGKGWSSLVSSALGAGC